MFYFNLQQQNISEYITTEKCNKIKKNKFQNFSFGSYQVTEIILLHCMADNKNLLPR